MDKCIILRKMDTIKDAFYQLQLLLGIQHASIGRQSRSKQSLKQILWRCSLKSPKSKRSREALILVTQNVASTSDWTLFCHRS